MGVPKQRHTKSRRNKRRMHLFLEKPVLSLCPKCGKEILPHTICWHCGYYKSREVIDVLAKLDKKERKKREKEMKAKETEPASAEAMAGKGKKEKPLGWEELSRK